jgi:hypothetical protein
MVPGLVMIALVVPEYFSLPVSLSILCPALVLWSLIMYESCKRRLKSAGVGRSKSAGPTGAQGTIFCLSRQVQGVEAR